MLLFGWVIYAYRRYRQSRQDELLQVVATATEAGLPLAPAVWAYVADRPRDGKRYWEAALFLMFPPAYLLWVQRQVFDERVARLAARLGGGESLPEALRQIRGLAAREV